MAWFGWGGNDECLNKFKVRYLRLSFGSAFYYDHNSGRVVDQIPAASDFAKHTQGMPTAPIAAPLAKLL